tara:strand:+ start:17018 stop:17431 length:414 start_codon:yes stop_codon:yes gene_type:complete
MQSLISWLITIQAALLFTFTISEGASPLEWGVYPLFSACLLIWFAWFYDDKSGPFRNGSPFLMMSPFALWPIAEAFLWVGLFNYLEFRYFEFSQENISFFHQSEFKPFWLENWVKKSGVIVIIIGGFFANVTFKREY